MIYPDLNLLKVFDLLFEERSVSRVAKRLNITQSAVSHSLGRLRNMIGDPLFTRGAGGLHPTARAEALAPQVREAFVRVRMALNPPQFDPGKSGRNFTIAAVSYICRLIGPRLVALAYDIAPGVGLRIVNVDQALLDELDQGTVDVAIGAFGQVPARIKSGALFTETMVWVSSVRHPLAGSQPDGRTLASQPSVAMVVDYPYRQLRSDGAGERMTKPMKGDAIDGPVDALHGDNAHAHVFDVDTAAAIAGRTTLLAKIPRRLALARAREEGLFIFEAETDRMDIDIMMLWHERFERDPGLAWLQGLITDVLSAES
jgi:DNA-binding transcriptional LysR family regulator